MGKKEKTEKKSLESWAKKELFDSKDVKGFLFDCEEIYLYPPSKMVTWDFFRDLAIGLGYY